MLLPILASGQIYVDSYKFAAPAADLILDTYSGAASAYSLRLLDKDYTSDCITVRRKSDGALDTFGFVNNYLDTTSLKSFCGTGATDTCWVRIWFDQSGNARNASQTTNANQPFIISSGNINKSDGEVSINFDGVNDFLFINSLGSVFSGEDVAFSFFAVSSKRSTNTTSQTMTLSDTNAVTSHLHFMRYNSNAKYGFYLRENSSNQVILESTGTYSSNTIYATTTISTGLNLKQFVNGTGNGIDNNYNLENIAFNTSSIGVLRRTTLSEYLDGSVSEIIVYQSNQSSNRTGIESNINTFYSIY
jgi:hypothetical protein